MTLDTRILALATQVGSDIKVLYAAIGVLGDLTTADKSSLVKALNELESDFRGVKALEAMNNSSIDDAAGAGVYNKGWSADKIISAIQAAKDEILSGAPGEFDTLKEIADYLAANDQNINDVLMSLAGTVRYDVPMSLTVEQQAQAYSNIGIGDTTALIRDAYLIARDTNTFIDPGFVEPGYVE